MKRQLSEKIKADPPVFSQGDDKPVIKKKPKKKTLFERAQEKLQQEETTKQAVV